MGNSLEGPETYTIFNKWPPWIRHREIKQDVVHLRHHLRCIARNILALQGLLPLEPKFPQEFLLAKR